jgi:hypothetical protein
MCERQKLMTMLTKAWHWVGLTHLVWELEMMSIEMAVPIQTLVMALAVYWKLMPESKGALGSFAG